jgi:nucleoside-diphosphate-sugar epimerase
VNQPRIAVVGGSGFVGRSVVAAFAAAGDVADSVRAPRLSIADGTDPLLAGRAWAEAESDGTTALVEAFSGCSVVVNAAGDASPTSAASTELWGANAVLPVVLALAAERAGVGRVVHVSSAAVQGSQRQLDERPYQGKGHSAYARSKGASELALGALGKELSTDIVVYRPTSVMGESRPITQRLASVLRAKWLMVPAPDVALPVAHVDHVGQAVVFLSTLADPPPIVLHPWESMTVASLATAFGRTAPIRRIPKPLAVPIVAIVRLLAQRGPLAGQARRIEMLWAGQSQRSSLPGLGFRLPNAELAYHRLGGELPVHSPR